MSEKSHTGQTRSHARVKELVPWSDTITAYDMEHLFLYARLLDEAAQGASEAEMIRDVLELEPGAKRAAKSLQQHLARARWMRENGYAQMLSEPKPEKT
jgi:hypothetical protein